MTLADPSLSLLNMDQESSVDEIPQHKITEFRYYCAGRFSVIILLPFLLVCMIRTCISVHLMLV